MAACYNSSSTLLPAASLTACLAWSLRLLPRKLRRGVRRGEMGSGAHATQPSDRRMRSRPTRRTLEGSIVAWMLGMGKGRVRLRASAGRGVSTGADTKANTRELVRAPGGLLKRLQRGVALGALSKSSSSFGTELVERETASMRRMLRVSMGADTKANTRELVRAPGGLLERLQRGVALDALSESSSSFGTELVGRETASMGAEVGAESVNGR